MQKLLSDFTSSQQIQQEAFKENIEEFLTKNKKNMVDYLDENTRKQTGLFDGLRKNSELQMQKKTKNVKNNEAFTVKMMESVNSEMSGMKSKLKAETVTKMSNFTSYSSGQIEAYEKIKKDEKEVSKFIKKNCTDLASSLKDSIASCTQISDKIKNVCDSHDKNINTKLDN